MAINRADGFGHFTSTTDWAAKGHNSNGINLTFAATGGRGNRGLVTIGSNSNIHSVLTAAKSTIFAHVGINASRVHTQFMEFRTASHTHIIIEGNEDGSFTVFRANALFGDNIFTTTSATTLGTSSPNLWRAATWHHLMVKVIIANSTAGEVTIYVDGVQAYSLTSINTYGGSSTVDAVQVGLGTSFGVADTHYSDLVIVDTDATDDFGNTTTYTGNLGDVAVYEYVNPSDGDLLNWTRSSGAGTWSSHVSQNPQDGDTTYLSSSSNGDEVCFFAPNVDSSIGTVLAVKETMCHRKENAGFASLKLFYRSNDAVNHYGPIISTTTSYIFDELLAEVDPKDASSWTNTKINNTQMGLRHHD